MASGSVNCSFLGVLAQYSPSPRLDAWNRKWGMGEESQQHCCIMSYHEVFCIDLQMFPSENKARLSGGHHGISVKSLTWTLNKTSQPLVLLNLLLVSWLPLPISCPFHLLGHENECKTSQKFSFVQVLQMTPPALKSQRGVAKTGSYGIYGMTHSGKSYFS